MDTLASKVKATDSAYQTNQANMQTLIDDLTQLEHTIKHERNSHATQRQHEQGKLLVRERIDLLIDPDTDFTELSLLAGHELYDSPLPCGGIITGIGIVEGAVCMVIANDATVKAAAIIPSP